MQLLLIGIQHGQNAKRVSCLIVYAQSSLSERSIVTLP